MKRSKKKIILTVIICVIVLIIAGAILTLLKIPVRMFGSLFGARGETVSHLVLSFIRYGGTIGVDTAIFDINRKPPVRTSFDNCYFVHNKRITVFYYKAPGLAELSVNL